MSSVFMLAEAGAMTRVVDLQLFGMLIAVFLMYIVFSKEVLFEVKAMGCDAFGDTSTVTVHIYSTHDLPQ